MKRQEKIDRLRDYTFELYPNVKIELNFDNEFQLLIAILMSAQTTDKQVNRVTQEFYRVFHTPQDWLDLWVEKIENYIKTVGLYKWKAKNIVATCKILVEEYNSKVPETLEQLVALPWVGIKTWKVFLSAARGASYLGVDTHVHRVLNRTSIVNTNTPEQTDKQVHTFMKDEDLARLHHTLIFFGRYFCTARNPSCERCELTDFCKYYKTQKNS